MNIFKIFRFILFLSAIGMLISCSPFTPSNVVKEDQIAFLKSYGKTSLRVAIVDYAGIKFSWRSLYTVYDIQSNSKKVFKNFFEKIDYYKGNANIQKNDYDLIIELKDFSITHSEGEKRNAFWHRNVLSLDIRVVSTIDDGELFNFSAMGTGTEKTDLSGNRESRAILRGITVEWAEAKSNVSLFEDIAQLMANQYEKLSQHASFLASIKRQEREKRALPSDLTIAVRFSDTSAFFPNNMLDAGEDSELAVTVKNAGKGAGYGTVLEVSADNQKIAYERAIPVGDIQPGEAKEIKVKLKAGLDIADGKTPVLLNLKEKRGYDARKVVYNLPTAKLERPHLEIISTELNDGDTGMAKGNGNGIPETGETVEVTAFIRNNGEGKAIGVNLKGDNFTSGVQWVRNTTLVGTILPGETAKAKLVFSIPRNFDAKEISSALKVSDVRGVSDAEKQVAYAVGKLAPDIRYACRIYSYGKPVETITNGEAYEVEFALSNSGRIAARDVTVKLATSSGATLSRSLIEIGEIKERATLPGQRVTLSVPRTYTDQTVPLSIEIAHSDFSTVSSIIDIPVAVKSPQLRYVAALRSKGGGNTLEQGEQAILELQVANEGNLSAEGVKVKIESRDENLRLLGKTEEYIGKVAPLVPSETVKFQLSTTKRIKPGPASLAVTIAQSDFSPVNRQYAFNIREEGAEIIDVAADEAVKPKAREGERQAGPTITLKNPILETDAERISLAFDVADGSRNIDAGSVRMLVNGAGIPLNAAAGLTSKPEKKKEIMVNIPLREGENRVVITARNTDYAQATRQYTIMRMVEDDVDTPRVTGLRNPDAVAVIVGISKYENVNVPQVDYARRDAEAIKAYLVKTLGYDDGRIITLYDEGAGLDKLQSAFRTKIRNMVVPGKSDVFVYYSGHGVPDVNSKEAYLVPYGFDPDDVENTGYIVKDLYQQLGKLRARSVTVAMDSCFSGSSEKGAIIKNISPVFLRVTNPIFEVKNSALFTASSSTQVSSWYHNKKHGLFTYYFLQGLRGKADADKDGRITVKELEEYVVKNVTTQAAKMNRKQTPEVMGDRDRVVVKLN